MKDIRFYKETTDDFYPNIYNNIVEVMYGLLGDNRFFISVSGDDDYMLCKISPNSLEEDLLYLLQMDYITKDMLKQRGFLE